MKHKNKAFCLNDYQPVVLTSVFMKIVERLNRHICFSIPDAIIPLTCFPSTSTEDATSNNLTAKWELCETAVYKLQHTLQYHSPM